ncbi:P1 family peptidase [Actinoplanes sp. NPDC049596]|uniref:P1 family peptidase n=1 Tax=Actinoplanes sp. NPDC049596 TaxID=3154625 RepID=UPI003437250D
MQLRIGHWTGDGTGVTVIVPPPGTIGSGEVRGGAPATREFALLDPTRLVDRIDAVVLSGGSALGLAAADGVARVLWEQGRGFVTPAGPVPIVIGMSIFDPSVATAPPTAADGRAALEAAAPVPRVGRAVPRAADTTDLTRGHAAPEAVTTDLTRGHAAPEAVTTDLTSGHAAPEAVTTDLTSGHAAAGTAAIDLLSGRVGAGAGATVGKWRGSFSPGGLGIAHGSVGDASVLAVAVVNAWGDVLGPGGEVLNPPGEALPATPFGASPPAAPSGTNTTIAVIATDARLTKTDCFLLAQSGHTGFARALHPAHSRYDGDAVVALSTGDAEADLDLLRATAAEVMADAIRRAIPAPGP